MIYRMVDAKKFEDIRYNLIEIICICGVLIIMCIIYFMNSLIFSFVNVVIGVIFASLINKSLVISLLDKFKKKLKK